MSFWKCDHYNCPDISPFGYCTQQHCAYRNTYYSNRTDTMTQDLIDKIAVNAGCAKPIDESGANIRGKEC